MPDEAKKLYRSSTDRILAGVCGGLANYFKIDPIIIRGAFVLLALADGVGVVLYVVLALIVPNEPTGYSSTVANQPIIRRISSEQARNYLGIGIILVGLIALAQQFFPYRWLDWGLLWPSAVIIFGIYLLSRKAH